MSERRLQGMVRPWKGRGNGGSRSAWAGIVLQKVEKEVITKSGKKRQFGGFLGR